MTRKQKHARVVVNDVANTIKQLTDVNPDCLVNATFYFHHIPEELVPEGFEFEKEWYRTTLDSYKTFKKHYPTEGFSITIFTD